MDKINQVRELVLRERELENGKLKRELYEELDRAERIIQNSRAGQESAGERFRGLLEEAKSRNDAVYCANALINTVLEEKARYCSTFQIRLKAEVHVPVQLEIKNSHLCSVFVNLLDNAIDACRNLSIQEREVLVQSEMRGDYLYIRVSNRTSQEYAKRPEAMGHGLGREIVSRIAYRYRGGALQWENINEKNEWIQYTTKEELIADIEDLLIDRYEGQRTYSNSILFKEDAKKYLSLFLDEGEIEQYGNDVLKEQWGYKTSSSYDDDYDYDYDY